MCSHILADNPICPGKTVNILSYEFIEQVPRILLITEARSAKLSTRECEGQRFMRLLDHRVHCVPRM